MVLAAPSHWTRKTDPRRGFRNILYECRYYNRRRVKFFIWKICRGLCGAQSLLRWDLECFPEYNRQKIRNTNHGIACEWLKFKRIWTEWDKNKTIIEERLEKITFLESHKLDHWREIIQTLENKLQETS